MALLFESLLDTDFSCSPDARFILEVIARDPGCWLGPASELSVKPFAKRLHVAERVVSAALSELVDAGAMERDAPARVGSGGRATVTYTLGSCHVDALVGDDSYPQHAELLQALFSGADMVFSVLGRAPDEQDELGEEVVAAAEPKKGRRQPPGSRGRLSIRNRLLFAVLLSRSDRFGMVQIGLLELARLTGMQTEQMKARLSRLMVLGLIRRHTPGLSSKVFAAGKVESTYYLNIDALKPQGAIAVHISYDWGKPNHAKTLHKQAHAYAEKVRRESGVVLVPVGLAQIWAGQRQPVFFLLQHLLYRYASHLLSHHWRRLASDVPIEDAELRALIKSDFVRNRNPMVAEERGGLMEESDSEVATESTDGTDSNAKQVCSSIYTMAMEVAHEYRARFGQLNWVDFEAADIRILPAMDDLGYKSITIMLQPAPVGLGRFSVFEEVTRENVDRWLAIDEAELTLQNRMDFGLVTLPRKVKRALRLQ